MTDTCTIDVCDESVLARGFCNRHYIRWRKHGDPLICNRNENRRCTVEGCGKKHFGNGFCAAHYARVRRHGDPMAGRTSPGDVEVYLREVVLKYDGDECLLWPYARNKAGYGNIFLEGRNHIVSRFVCQEVNGPPPTPEHHAAHSCGKGRQGCVSLRHLSWKEPVENIGDKRVHGTLLKGSGLVQSKISEDQAREILFLKGKKLQREIAAMFGISQTNVSLIHRRMAWMHIVDGADV